MAGNNDVSLKVGFDLDKFSSSLNQTQNLLTKWSSNLQGQLFTAFSIQGAIGILKSGISDAIQSMAQFERQMSNLKAITGATGKEFEALRNNALELGGSFKSLDIAKMEVELGRLGFTTAEILKSTETAVGLAVVSGEDLAKSAMIAGSTLRSFNLSADQMGRVGDVMAASFNKSALGLDNFGEAIKYVAPVAAAAGISLEQVAAMLGVLADNGIKGSMAGTSLRKIISDLGQGAAPVLTQKLDEMSKAGLSGAAAMDEVGRTAYASLLVLSKNTEKIDEATEAYKNVNGELERMKKIVEDNLLGDWNKMQAQWDSIVNGGGGGTINEFLRDVTQNLTDQLRVWNMKDVSFWEKFFGSRQEYAEYLKMYDDLMKKQKDYQAQQDSIHMGTFIGGGIPGFKPLTAGTPGPVDPLDFARGHAENLKNSATYTGGGKDPFIDNSKRMEALKTWVDTNAQIKISIPLLSGYSAQMAEIEKQSYSEALQIYWDNNEKALKKFAISAQKVSSALRSAVVDMVGSVGKAIGMMAAGVADSGIEAMLLGTMGSIATQLGELCIEIGIGMIAVQNAFKSPYTAIAAGVALVALGAYASSKASQITGGGGGSESGGGGSRMGDYKMQPLEMKITGHMTARGTDLVYVFDKQNYKSNRVGG